MERMTKVTLEPANGGGVKQHTLTVEQVTELCLEACGGGYTAEQTANAMEMSRKLFMGGEYKTKDGLWRGERETLLTY